MLLLQTILGQILTVFWSIFYLIYHFPACSTEGVQQNFHHWPSLISLGHSPILLLSTNNPFSFNLSNFSSTQTDDQGPSPLFSSPLPSPSWLSVSFPHERGLLTSAVGVQERCSPGQTSAVHCLSPRNPALPAIEVAVHPEHSQVLQSNSEIKWGKAL